MASINRIPVFIVGGGPVGLALAVALDRFGIRALVVAWRMAWCPPDPKAELASAMSTLLAGTVADHPAMAWR